MQGLFEAVLAADAPKVLELKYTALLKYVRTSTGRELKDVLSKFGKLCSAVDSALNGEPTRVLSPPHTEFFIEAVLPKLVSVLVTRQYTSESDFPAVQAFLPHALQTVVVVLHTTPPGHVSGHITEALSTLLHAENSLFADDPLCPPDSDKPAPSDVDRFVAAHTAMSSVYATVVESFGLLHGFDALYGHLAAACGNLASLTDPKQFHSCVGTISRLFACFAPVIEALTPPHTSAMIVKVQAAMEAVVSQLKSEHARSVTADDVCGLLDQYKAVLLPKLTPEAVNEKSGPVTLAILDALLHSAMLEKRVYALNELTSFLTISHRRKAEGKPDSWFNEGRLLQFIRETCVIEYLFGVGIHQELLVRCQDLLIALCNPRRSSLSLSDFLVIWSAVTAPHHEAVCDAAATAITAIVPFVSDEFVEAVVSALAELSFDKFTPAVLRVADALAARLISLSVDGTSANLAQRLFDACQDDNSTRFTARDDASLTCVSTLPLALIICSNLLKSSVGASLLPAIIDKVMTSMTHHVSVPQALFLLHRLAPLEVSSLASGVQEPPVELSHDLLRNPAQFLSWLQHQHDVLQVAIDDLVWYQQKTREGLGTISPGHPQRPVLVGRHPHDRQMSQRVGMIVQFARCALSPVSLSQLHQLWDCLVIRCTFHEDCDMFWKLVTALVPFSALNDIASSGSWPSSVLVSRNAMRTLVCEWLPSFLTANTDQCSEAAVTTFLHGFVALNVGKGLSVTRTPTVDVVSSSRIVSPARTLHMDARMDVSSLITTSSSLEGMDAMWSVALKCLAREGTVAQWLTHLHAVSHDDIRAKLRSAFIDRCMSVITSSSDTTSVQHAVQLLSAFITACESIEPVTEATMLQYYSTVNASPTLSPAISRLLPPRPSPSVHSAPVAAASGGKIRSNTSSDINYSAGHSPKQLTRQASRTSSDFASDDMDSVVDSPIKRPAADALPMEAPRLITVRVTAQLHGKSHPMHTVVDAQPDGNVIALKMAIADTLSLPLDELTFRHCGSELSLSDDLSTLNDVAIRNGARVFVSAVASNPSTEDASGTSGVAGLQLPPEVKDDVTPPSPTANSTLSSAFEALQSSPLPKQVSSLLRESQVNSPGRTRSPAARSVASTASPLRHTSTAFFAELDPDVSGPVSVVGSSIASSGATGNGKPPRSDVHLSSASLPVTPSKLPADLISTPGRAKPHHLTLASTVDVSLYPSVMMANHPEQFTALLALLDQPSVCESAWALVSSLPPNAKLKAAVRALPNSDCKQAQSRLQSLFPVSSGYRTVYALILLESVVTVPDSKGAQKDSSDEVPVSFQSPMFDSVWCRSFVSVSGLSYLEQLLLDTDAYLGPTTSHAATQSFLILLRLLGVMKHYSSIKQSNIALIECVLRVIDRFARMPSPDTDELIVNGLKLIRLHASYAVTSQLFDPTSSHMGLQFCRTIRDLLLHESRHVRACSAALCAMLCFTVEGAPSYDAGSVPHNEPAFTVPAPLSIHALNHVLTPMLQRVVDAVGYQNRLFEGVRLACRLVWRAVCSVQSDDIAPFVAAAIDTLSKLPPYESDFQPAGTLESPSDKVGDGSVSIPAGVGTALLTCYTDDDPYDGFVAVIGARIADNLNELDLHDDDGSSRSGGFSKAPHSVVNDEDVMVGKPQDGRDECLAGILVMLRIAIRGEAQWSSTSPISQLISARDVPHVVVSKCIACDTPHATMLSTRIAAYGLLFEILTQCITQRVGRRVLRGDSELQAVTQVLKDEIVSNESVLTACREVVNATISQARNWSFDLKPWDVVVNRSSQQRQAIGLINPGCVCYCNALVQQMFAIPAFRSGILNVTIPQSPEDNEDNVLLLARLQQMFGHLQYGIERAYDPTPLFWAYKDFDGQPTNVRLQQDASEFLMTLTDRIESALSSLKCPNYPAQTYCGTVVNKIKGVCGHSSRRSEPFSLLSLPVVGCGSLEDALLSHTKPEQLCGDNAYACDDCGCKVTATKRLCLGKLPDTLIVHLKRFEFDMDTMERYKVDTRVEFPRLIDFMPFTESVEEFKVASAIIDEDAELLSGAGHATPGAENSSENRFELVGVVVHRGSATSGHYFSYIKQGEDWTEFNDHVVKPYDIGNLASDTFGGPTPVWQRDALTGQKMRVVVDNPQSAYMCVYHRVGVVDDTTLAPISPPTSLLAPILTDNARLLRDRVVFDPVFGQFLHDLLSFTVTRRRVRGDTAACADDVVLFRLCAVYLFQIAIRGHDKSCMVRWLDVVTAFCDADPTVSHWLMDWLSGRPGVVRGALLECSDALTRQVSCAIVFRAAATVFPDEVVKDEPGSVFLLLDGLLSHCLPHCHTLYRQTEQLYGILSLAVDMGEAVVDWLLCRGAISSIVDVILGDKSPLIPKGHTRHPIHDSQFPPHYGTLIRVLAVLICSSVTGMGRAYATEIATLQQEIEQRKELLQAVDDDDLAGDIRSELEELEQQLLAVNVTCPTQMGSATHTISDDERQLMLNVDAVSILLHDCCVPTREHGQSYRHGPADILKHLCWNDKAVSEYIVANTILELEEFGTPEAMKPALVCLAALLTMADSVQATRVRRGLNTVNGLPSLAAKCRVSRPHITATLIMFIQSLHAADPLMIGRYLDALRVETVWMSPWLASYEAKFPPGQPATPARAGVGHEDDNAHVDIGDDVFDADRLSEYGDNGAFDKLSSFSGDGDDDGSPMGSSP